MEIRADVQGADVVVSVEDAGPGLPGGELDRLFAKFHRGTVEGSTGGAGLGLTICRAIVDLHGGRIWAERGPQGGAVFRFALPCAEPPPPPPRESPE